MSRQKVVVIADSTLAIPAEDCDRLGIRIVPVLVVVDGTALREGVDITPAEVADKLRAGADLTTSRPSPHEFQTVYQEAADAGATAVVSVHLSAVLSGTVDAARVAARTSPVPVRVIDTGTITMAGGYAAIDAATAAADGAGANAVADAAVRTAGASSLFFYVDTLEYLRRGGRIGAAQRYLGQALRMKPLLTIADGGVAALEKVRTSQRALTRLAEIAGEAASMLNGPRLAVHHLQAAPAAEVVRSELLARVPGAQCEESEVGAVIGVHSGPGMVAVAVVPGALR